MKAIATFLLAAVVAAGCSRSGRPDRSGGWREQSQKGSDESSIFFMDSKMFDKKFSSALKKETDTVVVKFHGIVTVNDLPQHLDHWFTAVDAYEGKVELVPDPNAVGTRGIGIAFSAGGLLLNTYNYIKKKRLFRPAKRYHATIYHMPDTGAITRVVFERKPEE